MITFTWLSDAIYDIGTSSNLFYYLMKESCKICSKFTVFFRRKENSGATSMDLIRKFTILVVSKAMNQKRTSHLYEVYLSTIFRRRTKQHNLFMLLLLFPFIERLTLPPPPSPPSWTTSLFMTFVYSYRVTANLVEDQGYWKKACKAKWNVCDVSLYGDDWKRMYFERYLEGKSKLSFSLPVIQLPFECIVHLEASIFLLFLSFL